jgi:hypothetical protein
LFLDHILEQLWRRAKLVQEQEQQQQKASQLVNGLSSRPVQCKWQNQLVAAAGNSSCEN